jgi:hypothetical protein
MSPGGNHFLGADDMSRAEKDCASMAKYLHEKCVGTGHGRSFYLCVLDGALRSAFPHLEKKMPLPVLGTALATAVVLASLATVLASLATVLAVTWCRLSYCTVL